MLFTICFGMGAAAFAALIALMLINRMPRSIGIGALVACVMTELWALAAAAQSWWTPGVAHALDSLSRGAWLTVIALTLGAARRKQTADRWSAWLPIFVAGVGLASFANDCRFLLSAAGPADFVSSQVFARVLLSVSGILLVENLYRNVSAGRRWNVIPLCIALGALFAYDLYVFSEAIVLRNLSETMLAGRGIVLALVVPLLVLTMARNPGWDINIHVSRRVVFHGVTLTAAGVFLLVAAGVAGVIGRFPGEWATVSEIGFFCGSVILLLVVLSTESVRSRLRRVIAENFFSTRYDYRTEWLRTITTLSSSGTQEPLALRAIRAVGDVVDSPGGALWLENDTGDYAIVQTLGMPIDRALIERASGSLVAALRQGGIRDLSGDNSGLPAWAKDGLAWVAVPLMKIDRLTGFVVLTPPRAPAMLNWESRDLLLSIGQQVASYLEEERATRALLESQALIDYSRRFSFVIHDIKNVSGQLGLMIANISRFGDRAEFRQDLMVGLENASGKLRKLLDRLRPDMPASENPAVADVPSIIGDVVKAVERVGASVRVRIDDDSARARIAASDLQSILMHLLSNAVEASSDGDEVVVHLRSEEGNVVIEIADRGTGMSAEFVRNTLFAPLRSTKPEGHGMGAYQARHLVRSAGGELQVQSAVGRGTMMRVILPQLLEHPHPPVEEAVS